MHTQIKVTPTSLLKPTVTEAVQVHPFDPVGAAVILGASQPEPGQLVIPVEPTAKTMFGPRGACLVSETGPLWVADTGHHRLLGWRQPPVTDGQPADWVIGQPDFTSEGQNAKGAIGPATFSVPTGVCVYGEGLAVADAWNHRVLIWWRVPQDSHVPADLVLGQADFAQGAPNRGMVETASDRLHWPYGVYSDGDTLWVADTGNRRVLVWRQKPTVNGQPADLVLGQPDMDLRNENGGGTPTAASMRWCHSMTIWQGNLVVADAGNNRVMIWDGIPTETNAPCAIVLGQADFEQVDINRGVYYPSSNSCNMPYGVTVFQDWLIVADTANSRLLGWQYPGSVRSLHNIPAQTLVGQLDFQSKGENRSYGSPVRDSLCWPYSVQTCGRTMAIADSGNNRLLLWNFVVEFCCGS